MQLLNSKETQFWSPFLKVVLQGIRSKLKNWTPSTTGSKRGFDDLLLIPGCPRELGKTLVHQKWLTTAVISHPDGRYKNTLKVILSHFFLKNWKKWPQKNMQIDFLKQVKQKIEPPKKTHIENAWKRHFSTLVTSRPAPRDDKLPVHHEVFERNDRSIKAWDQHPGLPQTLVLLWVSTQKYGKTPKTSICS